MTKEQQKMIERLRNMGLGYRRIMKLILAGKKVPMVPKWLKDILNGDTMAGHFSQIPNTTLIMDS